MKQLYNWILGGVLLISIVIAMLIGSTTIALHDLWQGNAQAWHMLLTYRLPRIIIAVVGGAILGGSGLLLQIVLRNRLIDASILGIMNGTQFVTIGSLVLLPASLNWHVGVGALGGILIMIGWRLFIPQNRPRLQMVLIGIATAMTFQALTNIASEGFGLPLPSLSTVTWADVMQLLIIVVIGLMLLILAWPNLKFYALSAQQVRLLGFNEPRTMWLILIAVGIWTGALTALLGVVFFLGAILPQIARLMAPRTKSQQLLPATMLWGSLLLINADMVARTILAPKELATSAVLLAISGPLFAVMLLKGSRHATT
ncbi:FecCD family ABC transporter permease [Weissella cibaria]|uniref:YfhA protein n=1 Tax=Weissella cibaria TaxID=137591 RepID=A0A0D1LVE4_9LACO|nr:iron ABC transporter permease [Weissella cibaria]ALI32291.1 iron ABC transporter permease [Weissella cibaria]KIU21229.1 putative siderophore transport system permease protein YfhA [Weissella cibaria]KIU22512.1 putative siderophore transport system permease protein YfhA [Weissella cibaria]MBD1501603.1 iron ABC transporter permease [Weissella cibaria]MCG4286321.1 iron ABC transporter permease [Weissella cibaria]